MPENLSASKVASAKFLVKTKCKFMTVPIKNVILQTFPVKLFKP